MSTFHKSYLYVDATNTVRSTHYSVPSIMDEDWTDPAPFFAPTYASDVEVDLSGEGLDEKRYPERVDIFNPLSRFKKYDRDDEYNYESADSIWEPVDRWSDKDPEVKTHAIAWWTNGTAPKAYAENAPQRNCDQETNWSIEPDLRNAYVEGNDAFLSLQVLDPELTRKYHARLLNWFLTKEGKVRVGSMEFGVNANGERFVQCVRACCKDSQGNWYKPGALIDNFSSSRETMETLVLSIIQHGNNCAASFIRSRADWYPIHSEGCDLNHSASEGCNSKANRIRFDGDVAFVMDHQQYCRDARCKCSEWLASEVPALSATA